MIKRLFSSQLRINMASGVAVTLLNGVVMAAAYPLYLHFLGYEQFGIWLVLSTVVSFAQLGNLGINQAVMKLVAEEYGRKDIDAMQQYISSAVVVLALSGAVVLAVILVLQGPIVALFKLSEENARVVSWLLPYTACLSIYIFIVQTVNAVLSGIGRMDIANYVQSGGRIVAVVVASILLYRGAGVASLLLGSALSYLFIHVVSCILILRMAPIHILRRGNLSLARMGRLLSFGANLCGGTLINIVFHSANRVILSRYAGVAAIPVYDIGFSASMQIRAIVESGLRALLPEISRISAEITETARDRIAAINRRALKLIFTCGVPLYGILFLLSGPLLSVWLGGNLPETLPAFFRVMLIASLASLLGVPAYYTLMGLGHPFRCFIGQVIPTAVHFTILIVLVLLGKDPTLRYMGYTLLTGVILSTLYLIARLHLCSYSVPVESSMVLHRIPTSQSGADPEDVDMRANTDVDVPKKHRPLEAIADVSARE